METRSVLFAKTLAGSSGWRVIFALSGMRRRRTEKKQDIELVEYRPWLKTIQDNVVPRFSKHRWRPVLHLDKRDLRFLWQLPLYALFRLFPKCLFNRFWQMLDPGVVCCFGNNPVSAEVIADCYRSGIRTVLCIASDADLSPAYQPGARGQNDYRMPNWMAWYAINTADSIMVQTERQRERLGTLFGREGTVIKNPIQIADDACSRWIRRDKRNIVLWVGRSDTFNKRPLLALDLARACGELDLVMIMNKSDHRVFETVRSRCPANVQILEHVPHNEIWDYYRRARAFISTSTYEGFPNTFLQAAVCGAPVVSLGVDPENILTDKGCGVFADGDFDRFVAAVQALWTDEECAERYAKTFFEYVRNHHDLDSQVQRLESFLTQVAAASGREKAPGCWRKPLSRFLPRIRQGAG